MNFPKDSRTNWQHIFFLLVLALFLAEGILINRSRWLSKKQMGTIPAVDFTEYRKSEEKKEEIGVEEGEMEGESEIEPSEAESEKNDLIREIVFPQFPENQIKKYKVPQESDIEYQTEGVSFKINYLVDERNRPVRLDINNKGKIVYALKTGQITSLLSFSYQNHRYLVLNDLSEGTDCCGEADIFHLDEDNNLKLIKYFFIGELSAISPQDFFIKNKKLYLGVDDCRFRFFCVHRLEGGNVCFRQYYLVEGDNLLLKNNNFKENYISTAQKCDKALEEKYEEIKTKVAKGEEAVSSLKFSFWFPDLTCKVVNYLLAGEEELAWKNFEETFKKFESISPDLVYSGVDFPCASMTKGVLSPEEIKQEIISKM